MESTEHKGGIGPALAVVIIVGVVAISGIYFYKHMVKDMNYYDHGATVVVPDRDYRDTLEEPAMAEDATTGLSTSTNIEAIAQDLEQELLREVDLSIIDDIDAELLNFEDLDDLDFNL